MDEQLQIELTKIVTKINNGADTAWGFLTEQTPDVIRQLLLWHGAFSALWFIVGLLLIIAIAVVAIKYVSWVSRTIAEKKAENIYHDPFNYFFPFGFGVALSSAVAIIMISVNFDWLKIWLAPKVWLLEYIANMAKSATT